MFTGWFVRLEPLTLQHVPEIADAVGADRTSYGWAPVPHATVESAERAVTERLVLAASGAWIPFVPS